MKNLDFFPYHFSSQTFTVYSISQTQYRADCKISLARVLKCRVDSQKSPRYLIFEPRRLFFHRETLKIHIRISKKPYKNFREFI